MHSWISILKPSRRRNGILILFALILINLSIFHKYLLPRPLETEKEGFLSSLFDHGSDDTNSSSNNTVPKQNSTRILLVSSLFRISKAKHSMDAYHRWLQRFLGGITTEVYFYTSTDLAPIAQSTRGELPITIDTTYNTSFDVPPLKGLEGWYNEMHSMDRENSYHSPELYSIWNAKPFFVDNAIRVMASKGKTYDYVFWNDAGSFRATSTYKNWPDPGRVEEIWKEGSRLSGTKAEDLLYFPIMQPPRHARDWNEDKGPIDSDFSEGEHAVSFSSPHSVEVDFIPAQVHFLVVLRVQWLGGHVLSTPTMITTPANVSLSGKIKLSSTPSFFYSTNVSLPHGYLTRKRLLQTPDLDSNPWSFSSAAVVP